MATIVGGIGTSHVPAIAAAIAQERQQSPQRKQFFDAYKPAQAWLETFPRSARVGARTSPPGPGACPSACRRSRYSGCSEITL